MILAVFSNHNDSIMYVYPKRVEEVFTKAQHALEKEVSLRRTGMNEKWEES